MFNSYRTNTLEFHREKCTNCGICTMVCPHGVFARKGKSVELHAPEACMECGACRLNCPSEAISVESGVGCAYAMIKAALTGGEESCDTGCCGGGGEETCECSCGHDKE